MKNLEGREGGVAQSNYCLGICLEGSSVKTVGVRICRYKPRQTAHVINIISVTFKINRDELIRYIVVNVLKKINILY